MFEKTLETEHLYKGKILSLEVQKVELIDGSKSKREIIRHSSGVVIYGITPEGKIPFVRQFRKPFDEEVLELPAGKIEKGEKPEVCALREFREETGYLAGKIEYLGRAKISPGYTDEVIYMYRASDLKYDPVTIDEKEFLNVTEYTGEEILKMVEADMIQDAKSLSAIYMNSLK